MEKHYHQLYTDSEYEQIISLSCSGPVLAMVWEGNHIIKMSQNLIDNIKSNYSVQSDKA